MDTNQSINSQAPLSPQINSPVIVSVVNQQVNQTPVPPATDQPNQPSPEKTKPPKAAKIISIYFWIMSLFSLLLTFSYPVTVLVINAAAKSSNPEALNFEIIKSLPYYYLLIPIFGLFLFIANTYAAQYIKSGSRKAWTVSFIIMIITPITILFLGALASFGAAQIENTTNTF